MKLQFFLDENGISQAEFSAKVGVGQGRISQIINRNEEMPPSRKLSLKIQKKTKNQVMCWDLRPIDWFLIWPELLNHPRAPKVPQKLKKAKGKP